MPPTTRGFDSPPQGTPGTPSRAVFIQEGDPGAAAGPLAWWVIPSTGAESIRNAANTAWIATSGSGAIPNIGQVLTAGDDAGAKPITNLTDPTNPQDAATKAYVDGAIPATPDLAAVLGAGEDAGGLAIGNLAALTVAVATIGPIADGTSSLGTIGQIATALGAGGSPADGWTWQDPAVPLRADNPSAVSAASDYVAGIKLAGDATNRIQIGLDASDNGFIGFSRGIAGAFDPIIYAPISGGIVTPDYLFAAAFVAGGNVLSARPMCRIGAGVPSGAPVDGENGMAADTTAVTGGLYAWTGAAWLKVSTI